MPAANSVKHGVLSLTMPHALHILPWMLVHYAGILGKFKFGLDFKYCWTKRIAMPTFIWKCIASWFAICIIWSSSDIMASGTICLIRVCINAETAAFPSPSFNFSWSSNHSLNSMPYLCCINKKLAVSVVKQPAGSLFRGVFCAL